MEPEPFVGLTDLLASQSCDWKDVLALAPSLGHPPAEHAGEDTSEEAQVRGT